jgi:hypothetical protein
MRAVPADGGWLFTGDAPFVSRPELERVLLDRLSRP